MYPEQGIPNTCLFRGDPDRHQFGRARALEVGADFELAAELAREVGYTELATFDKRRRGSIDLPPAS